METESKNLLIVCYSIPPNPGIGGRRWAKFAKYLNKKNVTLNIIGAKLPETETSVWLRDIEQIKSNIHYVPSSYPSILKTIPQTIPAKIWYRLALYYCRIFIKGNYYDRSAFWKNKLIEAVEELILKNKFTNLIVTCAPFHMAAQLLSLKKKYPEVQFIADFRDPWVNNQTSYNVIQLGEERFNYEKKLEELVIKKYDKIVTVAQPIKDYFISEYNIPESKVNVIPNGFDIEDKLYDSFKTTNLLKPNSKIKVAFTGTFYGKAVYLLQELKDVLLSNKELANNIEFYFFGDAPPNCLAIINSAPDSLIYKGKLPLAEVYRVLNEADFAALFLTDDLNYTLSTKFLEYVAQKKPILVFSKPGSTSNLVTTNNMGVIIESGLVVEGLKQTILLHNRRHKFYVDSAFDVNAFNISELTNQVISLLK